MMHVQLGAEAEDEAFDFAFASAFLAQEGNTSWLTVHHALPIPWGVSEFPYRFGFAFLGPCKTLSISSSNKPIRKAISGGMGFIA